MATGDVNGDGFDDIVVGSQSWGSSEANQNYPGRAYLYLGSASGPETDPAWQVTPPDGAAREQFGNIAAMGDFNGDGFDDAVIGSIGDTGTGPEHAPYLRVYGGSGSGLSQSPLVSLQGYAKGLTVADVNGDGFDDLIAATQTIPQDPGPSEVVTYLGGRSGLQATPSTVWTAPSGHAVMSIANAGDLNGDGRAEVAVGVEQTNSAAVLLFAGSPSGITGPPLSTSVDPKGAYYSGFAEFDGLAGGQDLTGDGVPDVAVGAFAEGSANPYEGRVYVYAGSATGLASTPSWSVDPADAPYARFGASVSIGDVTGDGKADLMVGAIGLDTYRSSVYLFAGSASGLDSSPAWVGVTASNRSDEMGLHVASLDSNGDGHAEIATVSQSHVNLYAPSAAADTTPPTVTGTPSQAANTSGWYNSPVTVNWTAADPDNAISTLTLPTSSIASSDGVSQDVTSGPACDPAGNCANGSVTLSIDSTPPSVSISGVADGSQVMIGTPLAPACTASDALSGLAGPCQVAVSGGDANGVGSFTATATATDLAGNTATTVIHYEVRSVDPPGAPVVQTAVAGDHSATITWLKPDSALPILGYTVTATPGGKTCSTSSADALSCTITGLTNGVDYTFTVTALSAAGTSLPPTTPPIEVTVGTAPAPVTGVTPLHVLGDGTQVTLTWLAAASDPNLPVTGYRASAQPGGNLCTTTGALSCTITGLTPGLDYAFTVVATNGVGSSDSGTPVTLPGDTTPPVVTGSTDRAPNADGWFTGPATVHWSATDPGNIFSELTTAADTTVTTDGAGQHVTSAPVCDRAGNCASGTITVSVDSNPPLLTLTGITEGGKYLLANRPDPGCMAADALSGLAGTCQVLVTGGNSNGVGTYTATGTATDRAGNTSTVTVHFKVIYRWDGFSQPINDTAHQVGLAISVFKAGSTVPAKFSVTDGSGHAIALVSAPVWLTPIKGVATGLSVDESVYSDPADSGAVYLLAGDQWKYNWKTTATQAGYYWRIGVRLDDGEAYYANIALR